MDLTDGILLALESMATWGFVLGLSIGILNGMIFGLLPGLSGSVGIALMIPFTFGMEPTTAMGLFVGALSSQTFAGSISAILLNTPGTSPNAATTFDGYPLARQGRGGFAIGISAMSSFLGSVIGVAILIALFPLMRGVILAFSFPEFTMLGVLGLAAIAVASRGSTLKGILAGLLGLTLSFVGFAPIGGNIRFVFDQISLYDGIGVVAVLIGLFALTEAVRLLSSGERVAQTDAQFKFGHSQLWEGARYALSKPWLLIRSALIGTGIGIVPAVGGTLASFLAYFQAAKTSKNPIFGRGDPRGVLAPEAANDAKDAGAALPTLAFGIPGSADWAIILGAMIIFGIQPGPNLIRDNPDIVWVAIFVIVIASFASSVLGMAFGPQLVRLTRIRPGILAPVVAILAVTGAFALKGNIVDVFIVVVAGLVGYAMRVLGVPAVPLILGLILGVTIERAFLQTLSTFDSIAIFVTRPISLVLVLLVVAIIVYEVVAGVREAKRHPDRLAAGIARGAKPGSVVFAAALALVAIVTLVLSTDFSPEAALMPTIVGWLLLICSVAYILIALVPPLQRVLGAAIADTGNMENQDLKESDDEDEHVDIESDGSVSSGGAASASSRSSSVVAQPEGSETDPLASASVVNSTPESREETAHTRTEVAQDGALDVRRRTIRSLLVIAGIAPSVLLFGIAVTVPATLLLFSRLVSRESWRTTAIVTVSASVALYLIFVVVLGLRLDGGLLLSF